MENANCKVENEECKVGAMAAQILSTETREQFDLAVGRAADALKTGEVVALPTETVYGLAANAFDSNSVRRIFDLKGRPAHNPIIVHVASRDMVRDCVMEWSNTAERLAKAFWPGPLTLVLPKSAKVPYAVTAGGETVGIRWPSHPFIQAVIRACGFPLAAPSANLANQLSPTNAEHVRKSFGGKIPLIVDGGQSQVGIESTVIDLSVSPPRLLRPGIIHRESLMAVIGELSALPTSEPHLKSPGQLPRHYAPRARLVVRSWRHDAELRRHVADLGNTPAGTHVIAHQQIPEPVGFGRVSLIPHDPEAYARALYAELHQCDGRGAELIIVEQVPDAPEWQAIADRLQRASS
jgi:L-threonylcarbamoyladenylate synthase